ncbi:MAG: GNAT family N-acetyltransferase [Cyanobacteria bacterium P01_C01_bin.120]
MPLPIQVTTGARTLVPGLIRTMSQEHLAQIELIWKGMLLTLQQPDKVWNWAYKLRLATDEARFEAYVVEVEELAQGVILIETQWHRSQVDGPLATRQPLVYVEYLATAPWNRRSLEDPPFFTGIGSTLMAFVRDRSVELGFEGRVGLHSLPQAENFYRRQGMPGYGPDPDKDGLVYFEYGILQR